MAFEPAEKKDSKGSEDGGLAGDVPPGEAAF